MLVDREVDGKYRLKKKIGCADAGVVQFYKVNISRLLLDCCLTAMWLQYMAVPEILCYDCCMTATQLQQDFSKTLPDIHMTTLELLFLQRVTVYTGTGAVWEDLTHSPGLPILNPTGNW